MIQVYLGDLGDLGLGITQELLRMGFCVYSQKLLRNYLGITYELLRILMRNKLILITYELLRIAPVTARVQSRTVGITQAVGLGLCRWPASGRPSGAAATVTMPVHWQPWGRHFNDLPLAAGSPPS